MGISRLPRNARFVDIASVVIIASMGFFVNAMYFAFEYFEGAGSVLAQVWVEPVEHALVMAMMPLYLAIGYIYWREKRMRRELETSNKLKGLYTDILSHDILNPVGVIRSGVELLDDSSEDRELIAVIKRDARRLEDMINNASKLAKMKAQEKLSLVDCDLGDYARTAMEEMKPLAREKKIEIIGELKGEYPAKCNPIFSDVLINLLSNAIKYSPTDSRVTVAIEDSGSAWRIMVRDNGPGIPDEHKEDIFQRFTRRDKGGTKGTGLGLAIVREIVALHMGEVWVEGNTPRGSIFYVKLPKEG